MTHNAVSVSSSTGEQIMTQQPVALRCRALVKHFAQQPVVRGVSLVVPAGDILVLVGPSGCGKTTTLRLIAGFERLDGGTIEIDGRIVAEDDHHLPPERRRVGMVFQDYALFPHLTVGQNVGFALGKNQSDRDRISQLLTFVGLPGQDQKMPYELSGGEQQRVSLARALSTRPAVLLLDEPFSNLDAALRAGMRSEVRALLKSSGTTAVFVTHDQEEALLLGDHVGVIRDGQLEQIGTPEDIFHRPQTRFVAEFLGQTRFIAGYVVGDGISSALGHLSSRTTLPVGSVVEIAVRPDDVTFVADEEGNGRVLSRRFTGISYLYQIGLPNEITVQSLQPHEMRMEEGMTVRVYFTADASPPVFYHGHSV